MSLAHEWWTFRNFRGCLRGLLLVELEQIRIWTLSQCLIIEILEVGVEALKLRKLVREWAWVDAFIVDVVNEAWDGLHTFDTFQHLLLCEVFNEFTILMKPFKVIELFIFFWRLGFLVSRGGSLFLIILNRFYTHLILLIAFFFACFFFCFLLHKPHISQNYIKWNLPLFDLVINLTNSLAFWFNTTEGEMYSCASEATLILA